MYQPYYNNNNFNYMNQSFNPNNTQGFNNPYQQQTQTIVRSVSGLDEARNIQIDPLNTYILTDTNNNAIYIKRINNNGLLDIQTYKLDTYSYNNFNNTNNNLDIINQRLTNIENILLRGVNDESNESNDASLYATTTDDKPTSIQKGATNAPRQNPRGNKTNGD